MARKNLLKGLLDEANAPKDTGDSKLSIDPAKPRYKGGAIGAVSQSIQSLKSRSVTEIDVGLIDAGGLDDRLDHQDDEDFQALLKSLKDHGQQVPILVRPHPDDEGRYQIVYGRRRVRALKELGVSAKALIRDLDDHGLVMAQGLENSARRDLSYIEKCNFAHQMREAGYARPAICDALSVDKTLISRMLQVIDRVGLDTIEIIGSSPGVGRDRWAAFAELLSLDKAALSAKDLSTALEGKSGDARFEAAMRAVQGGGGPVASKQGRSQPQPLMSRDGKALGKVTRTSKATTLTFPAAQSEGFSNWLVDQLGDLHAQWEKSRR